MVNVCSNKGSGSHQRGYNHKNLKIGRGNFNMFSRTTGLILTTLGTNYPRMERIQVSLKEGDSPRPRGDNSKIVKIHKNFKNRFLQNQQAKINQIWYKLSLGEGDSSLFN